MPVLKKSGLSLKEAHATSVLIMAALSVLSAYLYLSTGRLGLEEAAAFIPGGIVGGVLGSPKLRRGRSRKFSAHL